MTRRTHTAAPQTLGETTSVNRLRARFTAMGVDASRPVADTPAAIPALEAAQSRIPSRYRQATVSDPRVRQWVDDVAANATAPTAGGRREVSTGPSLLLLGATGVGKTHEAIAAIRTLIATGIVVRWESITAADLYGEMRPRQGVDPEWMLRRLVRIPVLHLDDLGAATTTRWTEELTYRLINHRYNRELPTLITSNLAPVRTTSMPPDQPVLREQIGDRVASRLVGMCRQIAVTGTDRRRAQPAV
ncbi:ATP-binding protein [Streptomyces sp. H27-H1]|uniref:ATP-binding protein n=1 Tax=Streptomyces sp. H27-H1 TaxID=2996461 RepID=UPI0022707CBD|nr:ATP-binding protein [Streptomyces sp. H27-H1]MCY0931507.1 ATP-binding protein [Streptomyces sp. H27-H1]